MFRRGACGQLAPEVSNIYTRSYPTTDVFERGSPPSKAGRAPLLGQAAETLAILAITRPGDEIVSANNLYGGTYQLFHYSLPKLGRTVKFVDSTNLEQFKKAISAKTRAVYAETIGNPKLDCRTSKPSRRSPTMPGSLSSSTTRWGSAW
jgi:O-acetylhomoserine (thiol)-lyase